MKMRVILVTILLTGCIETTAFVTPQDVLFCNKMCSGTDSGSKEVGKSIIDRAKIVCKCLDGSSYDLKKY
jgi:hypothetical protein